MIIIVRDTIDTGYFFSSGDTILNSKNDNSPAAIANQWISWALGLAFLFLFLSLVHSLCLSRLLAWAAGFYGSGEEWRYPHLVKRIYGYLWFLPALSIACLLWFFTLCYRQSLEQMFIYLLPDSVRRVIRSGAWIAFGILAVTGAIYFSNYEWNYYGRPLWDYYCTYADLIHSWLFSDTPGTGETLHAYMNWDYHSNQPVGPFVVAMVMKISGWPSVESLRLTCSLLTIATVFIVWRVLKSDLHADWDISVASILLLASNMAVVVAFIFPFTDPFVMFWATSAWAVGLKSYQSPSWWKTLFLLLIVAMGGLLKISLFTLLGLVPIWWLIDCLWMRNSSQVQSYRLFFGKKFFGMLLFTLMSLAILFCLVLVLDFRGHFFAHINDMSKFADSYPIFVLLSFLITCGPFLPLVVLGRDRFSREDYMLLSWCGIYLTVLWLSHGPGWIRYYIPILPALAVVSAKGLSRIQTIGGRISLWTYVMEAASLSYLGLRLRIHI